MTPFPELKTPNAIFKYVTVDKKRPNEKLIPSTTPPEVRMADQLVQLMKACWQEDPDERPTFSEVVATLSKIAV
jgi:hypothetical protein